MNILPYKYNLPSITILDVQNVSLFIIAWSTLFSYLYYNLAPLYSDKMLEHEKGGGEDYTKPFYILSQVVTVHTFIDIFLVKSYDVRLHHLCIIGFIFYAIYYDVSPEYRFIFVYPALKVEISSIFYVLKYWLKEKTMLYNINLLLLYISFAKLRIYDFYYEVIDKHSLFEIFFQKYSHSNYVLSSILIMSCYVLYILNIYWFLIMNKILYKTMNKMINIDSHKLCHFFCYYLHWINIPVAIYIYSYVPNEKYIFDIVGIVTLSISSYMYHVDVYRRLHNKQIETYDIPDEKNIVIFLNDVIFIHVRSFLVIVTSYYYSQHMLIALFISGTFHVFSIYYCILNVFDLLIDYNKNKTTFLNYHNLISSIPVACDVILTCINSPKETSIPLFLVNITIGLLFVVDPFYKLTHVGFHILLILQNYYICLSNVSNM